MADIVGALCGLGGGNRIKPARGDGNAVLAAGARFNAKPQSFQRQTERLMGHAFVGADPNDQNASSTYEVHEPVEGRFESFDRVRPPGDKSDVVLAARNTTSFSGCHTWVAAAMQLQEDLSAIGARRDHSM